MLRFVFEIMRGIRRNSNKRTLICLYPFISYKNGNCAIQNIETLIICTTGCYFDVL